MKRGLFSPVAAALRWWTGALSALGAGLSDPDRGRRTQVVRNDGAYLIHPSDGSDVFELAYGETDALGRALRGRSPLIAVLPPSDILAFTLRLPEEAAASTREAVSLQIEELTPFTEEEVIFDLRLAGRDPETGELLVSVALTPRNTVIEFVGDLRGVGARVSAVAADILPEGFDTRPRLDLGGRRSGLRTASRAFASSALAAALGAAVLVYASLDRQAAQLEMLQDALRTEAAAARSAAALDAEIRALRDIHDAPVARRALTPPPVAVLDEATRLLPDGSWLTGFALEGDSVSLIGFTDDAAALLRGYEASAMFEAAAFSSPIAKDEREQRDRFSMTLKLSVRGGGG